ncbi:MAG: hypothetical protein JXA64_07705 [Candidatus Fermentibacteraceae bacterium]|nr:hypothetical protein [Candidatus Fermentibacteraceae bacterium]MBN2608983.1 hypothetical protein [Candidatus Fermentibacteraceae bacterium]
MILFHPPGACFPAGKPGRINRLLCPEAKKGNYNEASKGDFSKVRLVNVGSAGQPRDRDPRAAYLLIDTETRTWEHFRVEYSVDDAAVRIREAALPSILWERLYNGF